MLPEDVQVESEKAVQALLLRDETVLDEILLQEFKDIENFDELMGKVFDLLPSHDSANPKLIYAEIRKSDNSKASYPIYHSIYELDVGDEFGLLQVYMQKNDTCCLLRHIKYQGYSSRPSMVNSFHFSQKTLKHFLFLALMISTAVFIVFTTIVVVKDKSLEKKWLWIIFVLFGLWGISMNWTTSEISSNFFSVSKDSKSFKVKLLDFTLLGAGFTRTTLFTPWIMDVGIPLGAIVYWFKRRRRN